MGDVYDVEEALKMENDEKQTVFEEKFYNSVR
jgi:hypothetical protein